MHMDELQMRASVRKIGASFDRYRADPIFAEVLAGENRTLLFEDERPEKKKQKKMTD